MTEFSFPSRQAAFVSIFELVIRWANVATSPLDLELLSFIMMRENAVSVAISKMKSSSCVLGPPQTKLFKVSF